jgi:hypothetical protein
MRTWSRARKRDTVAEGPRESERGDSNLNRPDEGLAPRGRGCLDYYVKKPDIFPNDGCIRRTGLDTLVGLLRDQNRLSKAADAGKMMDRQWCPR